MAIGTILKSIFAKGTATLVEKTGQALDSIFTSKEEIAQGKIELEKIFKAHEEKMMELSNEETKAYLADVDSARKMQITALTQEDKFSKRYVYYLASGIVFLVFIFDFLMFTVRYPAENRDMINQVSGILNATALTMVLGFFFGSSKSSSDKQEVIKKMMDNQ